MSSLGDILIGSLVLLLLYFAYVFTMPFFYFFYDFFLFLHKMCQFIGTKFIFLLKYTNFELHLGRPSPLRGYKSTSLVSSAILMVLFFMLSIDPLGIYPSVQWNIRIQP